MTHKRSLGFHTIRLHEAVLLFMCAILGMTAMALDSGNGRHAVDSSETRFAEASASGLSIVPASCPSSPHYAGECSVPTPPPTTPSGSSYCTITATRSSISRGQSTTLSWSTSNSGTITPGIGGVASAGSTTVAPDTTTTYSYYFSYNGVNAPDCSVTISVTTQTVCPEGQHMVGQICICDGTNYPPDATGQCTIQQCPTGFQWVNGQCIAVNQCQLPTSCADDTHVLNQCTGQATDCAATYGAGWYCSGGACHRPAPPVASISAVPSLLPPNRTTSVAWTSSNTISCSVSGTNGDGSSDAPWTGKNGSHVSSPITAQTTYTLTCRGIDGSTLKRTAIVSIIPDWVEE